MQVLSGSFARLQTRCSARAHSCSTPGQASCSPLSARKKAPQFSNKTRTVVSVSCQQRHSNAAETFGEQNERARRGLLLAVPAAGVVSTLGILTTPAAEAFPFGGGSIPPPDDVAAPPPTAEITKSGLATVVLQPATGEPGDFPGPTDEVTVDYTGWTTDGKMFDSSVTRGQRTTFPLNAVIKGWTEGLQLMRPGETRRLWIPQELAYGGAFGKPAGMLVFDVTLYSVKYKPKPPPAPEDVAEAPADAEVTASGLASKVIAAGLGGAKPKLTDNVTVEYTGWFPNGVMFDSSVPRGAPITFPLNRVIKGWSEGVQLMEVGERRRFWIPAELAYGSSPPAGAPAGPLVFDVNLLKIN